MLKWKHTQTRLSDNKFCAAIINKHEVFCKCGQKVILDNDYDEKRLNEHSRNSRLREDLEDSSPPPPPPSPPSFPNKPCPGLHSEQIVTYINRTPATYGGARRREVIGKEMFPNKFPNKLPFNSKKLNKEEITDFNQQMIVESEWFIDRLDRNDCKIETYDDIYKKISDIKQRNAIAKYVRVYVLQVPLPRFPPVIVALIPTGNDSANKILALHQKLIDITADFELPIISIRSDGAAAEFQAQNLLQSIRTKNRVQHRNSRYRINFNCPVFPKVGPIVRIQDPKHGKKTARNAAMSGARLLTFGYDFNEYAEINLSNNNLECLRYWPSDIEIDNAISIGYERAIHLAKYLEMTAVPDAYYFNIHKRFPDLQLDDFWDDNPNPRIMDSNDELNVDNLSTNQCINHAISKMNINREEEINSDDSQITFPMEKNYNCQVIVELVEKLPDIPWFPNDPKFNCNYILDGELNVDFFLDLRQSHDAYTSRNLERTKTVFRNNENNTLDKLDVNIASNLVSYLTKNDDSTLTKLRENRWKSNKKTDNNTKDHPRADNSAFLPLQIGSFVIAKFDNTFCVAQIIAMYEQKSLMHSYTDTPVSDLKSLSYVSMKIFFHVNASHIIHHLVLKDVIISEEALILKGQTKEYFNALLISNNK
ncbi:uncharacterized protein OCT59_015776 [Rhizophagus irregularis]|uniref:uncharacterized protein n=1 Tax=Rhizophagus irregularis TaxID=588596 RepID=UPI00331F4264|nr:hypothetical protein OCT59_015776 [Rhizophagus irregularis]